MVTQTLPDQKCVSRQENGLVVPFPYFATFVSLAAPINNLLNVPQANSTGPIEELSTLQHRLVSWYQRLPLELEWTPRK